MHNVEAREIRQQLKALGFKYCWSCWREDKEMEIEINLPDYLHQFPNAEPKFTITDWDGVEKGRFIYPAQPIAEIKGFVIKISASTPSAVIGEVKPVEAVA